ncbi:TolC family protein [Ruegeria arenilitoris]|uniref:TolC family protein n=1 Tax=Ruegeria arenilitoris TaxID=1173585 RepID=UPI00147B4156
MSPYLRVSQLVYDGGAAVGTLTAARAKILESRGDQLQTASATALTAIETYIQVLDLRKIREISQRNVTVHEEIALQIAQRVSGGLDSNADVLTAQSRAADARTRYAEAKARVDRAEARYQEVFGLAPLELPPPLPAPDLNRADTQIVMDSPQIKRAEAALLAAKAEQSAALARRSPEIRVSAFANQDRSRDANFGVDFDVNYEFDSTKDIAFLHAGQSVKVKITAYDFSRYGSLDGEIIRIGADTITRSERSEEEVFVVEIRTSSTILDAGGEAVEIIPGMIAEVDILSGQKTVLDYLIQPVLKVKESAFRE